MHAPLGFSGILFAEIEQLLKDVGSDRTDRLFRCSGWPRHIHRRAGWDDLRDGTWLRRLGSRWCGVSNLEALAEFGTGPLRAVTLDAGEVTSTQLYTARLVHWYSGASLQARGVPCVATGRRDRVGEVRGSAGGGNRKGGCAGNPGSTRPRWKPTTCAAATQN